MKYFVLVFEIVRDDCTVFSEEHDGTKEYSSYKTCLMDAVVFLTLYDFSILLLDEIE